MEGCLVCKLWLGFEVNLVFYFLPFDSVVWVLMGACDSVKSGYGGFGFEFGSGAFVFEVVCRCDWEEIGCGVVLMVVSKWLWVSFCVQREGCGCVIEGRFVSFPLSSHGSLGLIQARERVRRERERS